MLQSSIKVGKAKGGLVIALNHNQLRLERLAQQPAGLPLAVVSKGLIGYQDVIDEGSKRWADGKVDHVCADDQLVGLGDQVDVGEAVLVSEVGDVTCC